LINKQFLDESKKKKNYKIKAKINNNSSSLYKPENTLESNIIDKKEIDSKSIKANSKSNNTKNKVPINNNNNSNNRANYSILTIKNKIPIQNSYLQTEKTHLNEDSVSNYDESKNYKLDLDNLKLNLDIEDQANNSLIDPVGQMECSFIQNSEINSSNFVEDDHNKENEVVVCISNLDMKIEDSDFNNMQKLNKSPSNTNNFDEKYLHKKNNIKSTKNNAKNSINKDICIKDNSSIKSKFEEIQLSLSKIKNRRDVILFNKPSNLDDFSALNSNKLMKIFDGDTNQTQSDRSNQKDVLSTRNDKALDSIDIETDYLETDENIKVYFNKKKRFILILLFLVFALFIFALLMYFFYFVKISNSNEKASNTGRIINNQDKNFRKKVLTQLIF